MTETPEESDQLPEEGQPGATPDDTGTDEGGNDSPGHPGEEETATGNRDAAGADEEGRSSS